jgi:BolA family transcriptional regulator, general stress-responsive regulator
MSVSGRAERLREILQARFAPSALEIIDESAAHHGHAGAADGRGHFFVDIASAEFQGRSLIEQHRLVYAACAAMLRDDIHALRLKTRAP